MDESREALLQHRIELYRSTLRAGVKGHIAIEYLRQIEDDRAELARLRHTAEAELSARGLAADDRPLRSLSHYVAELVDRFSHLPITDPRRAGLARRIRRVEAEIARRRRNPVAVAAAAPKRFRDETNARADVEGRAERHVEIAAVGAE